MTVLCGVCGGAAAPSLSERDQAGRRTHVARAATRERDDRPLLDRREIGGYMNLPQCRVVNLLERSKVRFLADTQDEL